jgi:ADP-heptose:LPS heptosyltransferase
MKPEQILFVRLDKIGDLCLTLPCSRHFGLAAMDLKALWLIQPGMSFILDQAGLNYLTLELCTRKMGLFTFLQFFTHLNRQLKALSELAARLKELEIQRLVIFQAPLWFYFWAWWQGFSFRSGRVSHPLHRLLLNYGIRQSRKAADRSELEYNWLMLEQALTKLSQAKKKPATSLLPEPLKLRAKPLRHLLELYSLSPGAYVVIHPGMAGSAPNWPSAYFIELIKKLSEIKNLSIVITGTAVDEAYLAPIRKGLREELSNKLIKEFKREGSHPEEIKEVSSSLDSTPASSKVVWLDGKLSSQELLFILAKSSLVIAPSTGVLHLAASLGAKCLGLYADEPAFHPIRWGPFISDQEPNKVKILISRAQQRKNLRELDDLSVDQVFRASTELLEQTDLSYQARAPK